MKTPTPDDLLNSLGLARIGHTPPSTQDWMAPALMFGVGILTGAAAAVLLTPKSGRELRGDIAQTANQLTTAVAESVPQIESPFSTATAKTPAIEAK